MSQYIDILTNLSSLSEAITADKSRSGIEAMFKDCKSGGYNMEGSKASVERLTCDCVVDSVRGACSSERIAYTCSTLQGLKIKKLGQQKYINRLQEIQRTQRRHSNFWIGQYGLL